MRHRLAVLAILALASSAAAEDTDVVWRHVQVVARLANDGSLSVTETADVETNGSVEKLGQDFGLGVEQNVTVKSLVRLDPDGTEHPLTPGDVKTADRYAAYPTWVRFSLKDEGAPATRPVSVRYRLDYVLGNAMAPAWDLPNGPEVLDGLKGSYGSPIARLRDAWAVWREAMPRLDRHYRLDHDVIFPSYGNTAQALVQLDYRLEWDVAAWRLVDPGREMGDATHGVDYRVRRTFERLAPETPAAVDFTPPQRRLAALLVLPIGVLVLWLVTTLLTALQGAEQKRPGPSVFKEVVLSEPPELVRARVQGSQRTPLFDAVLARLATERRIAIESQPAPSEDAAPHTQLRLLADRASLHAFDREIVEGVFGGAQEVTAEKFRARHPEDDPQDLVDAAFARVRPRAPKGSAAVVTIATILFFAGLGMSVAEVTRNGGEPYAPLAAVFGSQLARLPLPPLPWLSLLGVVLQLVSNRPLVGIASFGLSVALLSGYALRLAARPSVGDASGRRLAQLNGMRQWAQGELQKARPALLDAWIAHLDALGLRPAIEKWRSRQSADPSSMVAPDLADLTAGEPAPGPPFTGVAPSGAPADDAWSEGFYPAG